MKYVWDVVQQMNTNLKQQQQQQKQTHKNKKQKTTFLKYISTFPDTETNTQRYQYHNLFRSQSYLV